MSFELMLKCSAGVAQLAEHDVANVVVEGSNPFARSNLRCWFNGSGFCLSRLPYWNLTSDFPHGWSLLSFSASEVWVFRRFEGENGILEYESRL